MMPVPRRYVRRFQEGGLNPFGPTDDEFTDGVDVAQIQPTTPAPNPPPPSPVAPAPGPAIDTNRLLQSPLMLGGGQDQSTTPAPTTPAAPAIDTASPVTAESIKRNISDDRNRR